MTFVFILCIYTAAAAQSRESIQGVFIQQQGDTHSVWMFVDGYCSLTKYKADAYISTMGGPFSYAKGEGITVQVEYDDAESDAVGKPILFDLQHDKEGFSQKGKQEWQKLTAKKQDLDALWRITGRVQEQKMSEIPRGDRKTIKILVDGYFQWIAINPATRGFYGTGGGKYSFKNGEYTENILFFSRDNSRVGAKLSFEGELKNRAWHHSGKSSKGDPIYEIWSRDK